MAARWDEVEGPLRGKVGQASVGTAVAHSHYCSSAASEEKGRSRHMATLPRLPPVPCHTHPGRPGSARRHHSQFALPSRVAGRSSKSERCCRVGTRPGVEAGGEGCRGWLGVEVKPGWWWWWWGAPFLPLLSPDWPFSFPSPPPPPPPPPPSLPFVACAPAALESGQ